MYNYKYMSHSGISTEYTNYWGIKLKENVKVLEENILKRNMNMWR